MDAIIDVFAGTVNGLVEAARVIAGLVAVLLITVVSAVAGAFVVRAYWNWFVEPIGFPNIGLGHALGLTMFVSLLRTDFSGRRMTDHDDRSFTEAVIGPFVWLGLMWGLGWLVATLAGPF